MISWLELGLYLHALGLVSAVAVAAGRHGGDGEERLEKARSSLQDLIISKPREGALNNTSCGYGHGDLTLADIYRHPGGGRKGGLRTRHDRGRAPVTGTRHCLQSSKGISIMERKSRCLSTPHVHIFLLSLYPYSFLFQKAS